VIAVSQENYLALKRLGSAGDSFNDVISEILKEQKLSQTTRNKVGHPRVEAKTTHQSWQRKV
jgi:predicted CopG family antitoxin